MLPATNHTRWTVTYVSPTGDVGKAGLFDMYQEGADVHARNRVLQQAHPCCAGRRNKKLIGQHAQHYGEQSHT
eukprot:m.975259 g.975259  ORF g.975259 m.975259 type:complete len:73 (+) comp23938_c0_seq55:4415-4633(+)